jgi:hypothetical protein
VLIAKGFIAEDVLPVFAVLTVLRCAPRCSQWRFTLVPGVLPATIGHPISLCSCAVRLAEGNTILSGTRCVMKLSFEQAFIEVWRQALVENAKTILLGSERYAVRRTPKRGLRQVDFVFERKEIRGLEQNPQTKSRWAQLARSGKKVMQFLSEGRYVANVVDGKVTLYGR